MTDTVLNAPRSQDSEKAESFPPALALRPRETASITNPKTGGSEGVAFSITGAGSIGYAYGKMLTPTSHHAQKAIPDVLKMFF